MWGKGAVLHKFEPLPTLGAVTSHTGKPVPFFGRRLIAHACRIGNVRQHHMLIMRLRFRMDYSGCRGQFSFRYAYKGLYKDHAFLSVTRSGLAKKMEVSLSIRVAGLGFSDEKLLVTPKTPKEGPMIVIPSHLAWEPRFSKF